MWSSDTPALTAHGKRVRRYDSTRFDKGARAFACGCALAYAGLSYALVHALLKALAL